MSGQDPVTAAFTAVSIGGSQAAAGQPAMASHVIFHATTHCQCLSVSFTVMLLPRQVAIAASHAMPHKRFSFVFKVLFKFTVTVD